jgi:hypothetical protein
MKTIGMCTLLENIFPGFWDNQLYLQMTYDQQCEAVAEWCQANNYFLYERAKESFFEYEGIQMANAGGYAGVVFSNLS